VAEQGLCVDWTDDGVVTASVWRYKIVAEGETFDLNKLDEYSIISGDKLVWSNDSPRVSFTCDVANHDRITRKLVTADWLKPDWKIHQGDPDRTVSHETMECEFWLSVRGCSNPES
jgi:hypothetical protein